MIRRSISLLISAVMLVTGCTRAYTTKIARLGSNDTRITELVPRTGMYKVKWTHNSSKNLHGIDETSVILREGDTVGFKRQDDGTILARAGEKLFELEDVPETAKYLVWYSKMDGQTQFGREMNKLGKCAGYVAAGAVVAGGAAGFAVAEGELLSTRTAEERELQRRKKDHRQ